KTGRTGGVASRTKERRSPVRRINGAIWRAPPPRWRSLVFDYATLHLFGLTVICERMNPTIAAAEKRAQDPTNHADNNRAPERAPKIFQNKGPDDGGENKQHETIHDENEKPQCQQNERRTQDQEDRPDKCVENAEQKRCANQSRHCVVTDSVN